VEVGLDEDALIDEGLPTFFSGGGGTGGSAVLFRKIPAGFLSDNGIIFNFSVRGTLGAEAPWKKSAGKAEEGEEEEEDNAATELPFSCFLFTPLVRLVDRAVDLALLKLSTFSL